MAHWKKIAGGLTGISAGSRSNVWGVNANGQIYRFTNDDATPWHGVPGGLSTTGHWKKIAGGLVKIS
ncbi:tectonin domain-containing protein [Streptomyces sp. NRRL F-5193]|uniref:tectonin domain-containing protein n=1 Tax=Streptomyces sp. NRRL F-5193 TaxID=1463860 RepID=UPI000690D0C4|nr:tectonin domain-containing protein [Streptomyces sp. NRRL F-5193]